MQTGETVVEVLAAVVTLEFEIEGSVDAGMLEALSISLAHELGCYRPNCFMALYASAISLGHETTRARCSTPRRRVHGAAHRAAAESQLGAPDFE